jgi:hypothetical protein
LLDTGIFREKTSEQSSEKKCLKFRKIKDFVVALALRELRVVASCQGKFSGNCFKVSLSSCCSFLFLVFQFFCVLFRYFFLFVHYLASLCRSWQTNCLSCSFLRLERIIGPIQQMLSVFFVR